MNETQERPLVTFALFAYNQEKYIREAIEGAFSQTYEPLEIILSDDCSTDRTFEIMQEMAASYKGPHKVDCIKNHENLGLILHVNKVIKTASSRYIVLAAGDDISYPDRVAVLVQEFKTSNPLLIHSDVEFICESGLQLTERPAHINPLFQTSTDVAGAALSSSLYIGASGAIDKEIFDKYGPITFRNAYEDLVLGYRAAMEGRVSYVNAPLVGYRWGVGMSTSIDKPELTSFSQSREIQKKDARVTRAVLEQRYKDSLINRDLDSKIVKNILRELKYWRVRYNFFERPSVFWAGFLVFPVLSARIIASEIKRCFHRSQLPNRTGAIGARS